MRGLRCEWRSRPTKAPCPRNPPALWGDSATTAPASMTGSKGTRPKVCAASINAGTSQLRATSTASPMGCSVPTSLCAWTIATRPIGLVGRVTKAAPEASTSQVTIPRWEADSRTAGCSMSPSRTGNARSPRPRTARFAASVPPLVKMTSLGETFTAAATRSRACSKTPRARRPAVWALAGLAGQDRSTSKNSSRTSGSAGVPAFASQNQGPFTTPLTSRAARRVPRSVRRCELL